MDLVKHMMSHRANLSAGTLEDADEAEVGRIIEGVVKPQSAALFEAAMASDLSAREPRSHGREGNAPLVPLAEEES